MLTRSTAALACLFTLTSAATPPENIEAKAAVVTENSPNSRALENFRLEDIPPAVVSETKDKGTLPESLTNSMTSFIEARQEFRSELIDKLSGDMTKALGGAKGLSQTDNCVIARLSEANAEQIMSTIAQQAANDFLSAAPTAQQDPIRLMVRLQICIDAHGAKGKMQGLYDAFIEAQNKQTEIDPKVLVSYDESAFDIFAQKDANRPTI